MKLMIQWAVTSSILILIVLAVRRLFREKLSARLRYALWGVVLLRLLIPFQVELPAPVSDSLPVLATNLAPELGEERSIPVFPQGSYAAFGFSRADFHRLEPGEIIPTDTSMGYWQKSPDGETITRYLDLWSPAQAATAVWGTGAVLMTAALTVSNLRFYGRLRKRRKKLEDVDAPIPVYIAEGLPSPCLFGVFRPAVYVTRSAAANPDTLRHVLAHELTHHAHLDHLWSLLRCLALALHWYNPLVWLAVVLSKQDGELACDEGAVARLGEGERIPYGRTLVDMVAARSLRPGDLLSCSTAMTGGGKSVKRRVAALVKKPETVKTALFAVIALVALGLVFVFAGRGERGKDRDYHTFLNDVENAQSIYLSQHALSSDDYLPYITEPELLTQAKDILIQGASDWLNPPSVLENLNLSSLRTLTLTGQDGQEVRYQLAPFNYEEQDTFRASLFCVFTEGSLSHIRDSRAVVLLDQETVSKIYELMLSSLPLSDAERVFLQAEEATAIQYCPSLYSSTLFLDPIVEEDLLAEAKDALFGFRTLKDGDPQPDLSTKELIHESRIFLTFEGGEMEYSLLWQNDHTYLFPGSIWRQAMDLKEEEGETAQLQGVSGTCISRQGDNVISTIRRLAGGQSRLLMDPMPMLRSELEEYTRKLLREGDTPLLGRPGGAGGLEFHYGCTSGDSLWLWYQGDKEHDTVWVLSLRRSGEELILLDDQPIVVFNAGRDPEERPAYEVLAPMAFAACLRPEDIDTITAGDYFPGQAVTLDTQALAGQLSQAAYYEFSDEFDREKYGQLVLTIQVKEGDVPVPYHPLDEGAEEIDETASRRLVLSVGQEADVVCLYHQNFGYNRNMTGRQYARSPELYRTIRDLFD